MLDENILHQAEEWRASGCSVAIATVIETWGSAPRLVGACMVVDQTGHFFGSVSGGCVEGDVMTAALEIIADGAPRLLEFNVDDDVAWRSGLTCGGRITIFVERLD